MRAIYYLHKHTKQSQVDDAPNNDLLMTMYNLIEYKDNYLKASRILWQYCRDKPGINTTNGDIVDFNADYDTTNYFIIEEKITGQTSSKDAKNVKIMVPLKYLINFWRNLEIPLTNCENNLDRNWSAKCVIVDIKR